MLDSAGALEDLAEVQNSVDTIAVGFARVLRGSGLSIPVSSVMLFVEALRLTGIDKRSSVYWSGRVTLLQDPEEILIYNRAFAVFWEGQRSKGMEVEMPPITVTLATDDPSQDSIENDAEEDSPGPKLSVRFSKIETLKAKDFSDCSSVELRELHQLIGNLKFSSSKRASLRKRDTKRNPKKLNVSKSIRKAFETDGEPIYLKYSRKDTRPRRLVLLLDVSGSMEPYARALIRLAHAAVVGRADVEAFTLGTRLTRITRELTSRDPDAALRSAADSVRDWSGGTRLGATLAEFNNEWGIRGYARGALLVMLSDGWDRGSPDVLRTQMERLQRVTHRLIWVNPLKHTPGYAPLAQGMAAALPYTDEFIEGHSFDSLERLTEIISS
ncbi:MAG: vWA domain-containing protein [Actinomycetota bacterium]|nr:VWA domain-containing protein [Acidimicrobiales bacterium]